MATWGAKSSLLHVARSNNDPPIINDLEVASLTQVALDTVADFFASRTGPAGMQVRHNPGECFFQYEQVHEWALMLFNVSITAIDGYRVHTNPLFACHAQSPMR